MSGGPHRILIVAGEASGDLHGGNLVRALHQIQPDLEFQGVGGHHMKTAGVDTLFDIDRMGGMGLFEFFSNMLYHLAVFRKLSREIAVLTSVGSAICGAAAIMATEPVMRARERDVTVAVATVVLFGTLAMFSYPVIYNFADMDPSLFGIYIGSTVHEVAQAVAAGQSIGGEAMQNAVVTKLIRVMLLAPVVIALGSLLFREVAGPSQRRPIPVPWFVFGFIATAAFNSVVTLPALALGGLQLASQLSLAIAMAALGIKTRWVTIRRAGTKPLALSLVLFIVLMVGGYGLNGLFYA